MTGPILLDLPQEGAVDDITVLALGAYLKNQPCLLHGGRFWLGGEIGDLDDPAACVRLDRAAQALLEQANGGVDAVAHDLHPDFYSTRLAQRLADRLQVPAVAVQHHHAHVAAVLAEHGWHGDALGLALDGIGLGSDGRIWGGELLRLDPLAGGGGFERLGHLRPLPLPGGDRAATEPWRMAAAVLHLLGRSDEIATRFPTRPAAGQIAAVLQRPHLCPTSTALGRWFDAAAGLLGLSEVMRCEAEAAIALEQAAHAFGLRFHDPDRPDPGWRIGAVPDRPVTERIERIDPGRRPYPSTSPGRSGSAQPEGGLAHGDGHVLDLLPVLAELADETDAGRGATRFHAVLITALTHWVEAAARTTGLDRIALSGGCFHNRILSDGLVSRLQALGLKVMIAQRLSPGDAGLAVGQARVAAGIVAAERMAARSAGRAGTLSREY